MNRLITSFIILLSFYGSTSFGQVALPQDVQKTCTVDQTQLSTWFLSGTIATDGMVKPVDSTQFQELSNCNFYKWSHQMFLWLTSPATGSGGRVFDSPLFYDVSLLDPMTKTRVFVPQRPGTLKTFALRSGQVGPRGNPVAVNAVGALEEVGVGQAKGNGVLISQNRSLVYYSTQVNVGFAYFLTGVKSGGITPTPTQFPTTKPEMDKVVQFASQNGVALDIPETLVMELKSSWIDVASVVDASRYITTKAVVPTYDLNAAPVGMPPVWNPTGQAPKTLALVGMHVVGTVNGHPEMLWATFEHVDNCPNESYSYTDINGHVKNAMRNTTGNWLFCQNGATDPFNQLKLAANQDQSIKTEPPGGTMAEVSNILRSSPWGGKSDVSSAGDNTDIISLNASIQTLLPSNDARRNYLQVGTTWTLKGKFPGVDPATEVGSTKLANTTMETFHQPSNCFSCHKDGKLEKLSHIYDPLQVLPLLKR